MSKRLLFLFILLIGVFSVSAYAEDFFYVYYHDGSFDKFTQTGADSISLVVPHTVSVEPQTQLVPATGGTVFVEVTSPYAWTASSNQSWVTLNKTSDEGDATVKIKIAANTSANADEAVVTFVSGNSSATFTITRAGSDTPTSVTDVCGNTYPVVLIGDQYWMAENMKCNRYSSKVREGATLTTSDTQQRAPYYTDGRQAVTQYSGNLSQTQREKLGLLYSRFRFR